MMTFDEIVTLRDVLARSLRAGSPAVVATLAAREGHSYRESGSMMLMTEALQLVGAVSGGCLEGYIGRAGRKLLRERRSVLLSFDTAAEAPNQPTLGCGGRLEILVERSGPEHLAFLDAVLHALETTDRAALLLRFDEAGAGSVGCGPRAVVADGRVVFPTGARLDDAERLAVVEAISLRESLTWRHDGTSLTAAYLWPRPRLVIFGARDDAMPLAKIARTASWHVTVADRRSRLATSARFPDAERVLEAPWPEVIAAVDWTPWTSAVLMTHSIEDDLELLPRLARLDLDYLGVLGPSARTQRLWDAIPAEQRQRVYSPIGLSLGEKSPAAVAIGIMAALIANRRGRLLAGAPVLRGALA